MEEKEVEEEEMERTKEKWVEGRERGLSWVTWIISRNQI